MANIGFVLPAHFCFSKVNGIREEALLKLRGLQALGHTVELLSAWDVVERGSLDVVHFFYGGLALSNINDARDVLPRKLVFSTTIDSNRSTLTYRLAAALGSATQRVYTTQGEFRRQCLLADAVIVRSQHERTRVIRGLGVSPAKVHMIPLGVDIDQIDPAQVTATDRTGILHLSTFGQARKNVLRLIEAVGPTGLPLTIAGSCSADMLPVVQRAADKYPSVEIRGFVANEEKEALYYASRVFALPSINEGTGLSALEAAARGCNVVITKNGGPPDYFSNTGILVDPYSTQEIRAAVLKAYDSIAPARTAALIAAEFSTRRCAERLVDIYAA